MTLMLLQRHRDTNGRRMVIQIGGVKITFCQEGSILLPKYRDSNGRSIAILFKSTGVRGRFVSPHGGPNLFQPPVRSATPERPSSSRPESARFGNVPSKKLQEAISTFAQQSFQQTKAKKGRFARKGCFCELGVCFNSQNPPALQKSPIFVSCPGCPGFFKHLWCSLLKTILTTPTPHICNENRCPQKYARQKGVRMAQSP